MSSRLQTALEYAERGIPVFPCIVNGKRPACANGLDDRTTDRAKIEAWWAAADYNIGMVPEDAGWGVCDFDGVAPDDRFPLTYRVRTPRGDGWHYYYEGSLPGSAGKEGHRLGPGIDTRGRGSYVLVPPSYVIDHEKGYEGPYVAEQYPIAPLPEWVAAVFASQVEARKAPDSTDLDTPLALAKAEEWLKLQEIVHDGSASDTFYRYAARLKDIGVSSERGIELLERYNPSYEHDDIAVRVGNAWSYGQNEPGSDTPQPSSVVFNTIAPPDPITFIARPYGWWGERTFEPIRWLVDGLIPEHAPTLITGQSKTGKTTWLLNLVVCTLAGRTFLGRVANNQRDESVSSEVGRDIVLFAAEDDYGPLRDNLHAIVAQLGLPRSVLDRVHIRSLLSEPLEDGFLARVDDAGNVAPSRFYAEGLLPYLKELERPLLLLDPITELVGFNRYADMSARRMVTNFCNGICREANATVIVTDHPSVASTQSGRDVAGSVHMEASFPVVLTLRANERVSGVPQRTLELHTKYNRFVPPLEPITFYRRENEYAFRLDGVAGSTLQDHMREVYALIKHQLSFNPPTYINRRTRGPAGKALDQQYIAGHMLTHMSEKEVTAALDAMKASHWVVQDPGGGGSGGWPAHLIPNPNFEPTFDAPDPCDPASY